MSDDGRINRIVIAFDGSDMAKRAFAYAVMVAERVSCDVVALHVAEGVGVPPIPDPTSPVIGTPPPTYGGQEAEIFDDIAAIEDEFDDMADYCEERAVRFTAARRTGELRENLLKELGENDLLAVGRKGRLAAAGFGSLTRALITSSPCPVLMTSGELRPMMRVVGVFDGSEPSLRAIRFARHLASQAKLPFNMLSVGGVTWSPDETLNAAQELAGDEHVLAVGPDDQSEADQILSMSDRSGLALMVLGAYPDSWFHQLVFGGTTGKVLREIDAPVVLVH